MPKTQLIMPLFACLALAAVTTPQALALAQVRDAADHPPTKTYTISQHGANLSPIVVHGAHIPFPVALQIYKKALTRPWTNDLADANKLVCRWTTRTGTHIQSLFCETNRFHLEQMTHTQMGILKAESNYNANEHEHYSAGESLYQAFENGQIPMVMMSFSEQTALRRSTLAPLLKILPPAGSSYTIRVTGDNGKPVLDYVFKDGDLVHVYHYVYKNGKAVKPNNR